MILLRFVIPDRDRRTGQFTGLMSAAYDLLRAGDMPQAEEDELRRHVEWVETNVPVPARFARKRNVSHKQTHGISWVKADAVDLVSRFRAIAGIAERHGLVVELLQTDRPGYIVHEDAWQVVAEPFHGD
ncbi:hypothetical protein GCM10027084_11140 [Pseudoxanthomonas sangjuensis]|uniref:hypothetical protein n=1 Tax=Pseudoxanthomonas sangjuensis TaxID=1503750 RepID=UPI0013911A12|nr:hypothetical protein [Pseudoxanthomonas sangjuensis]